MSWAALFRGRPAGLLLLLVVTAPALAPPQKYAVTGLLLASDPSLHTITVSCREIPGYMDPMVMSFPVHDRTLPDGLQPGMTVEFALVVEKGSSFAEDIKIRPFESLELDPTEARRFKLMENASSTNPPSAEVVRIGQTVPDFRLVDQNHQSVALSQFAGKVVVLTFIYTRCPRPDYCLRLSNNLGILQRRFGGHMGQDLVLLTVVIDPAHDQPDALRAYARTWKADSRSWHFLTGSPANIQRICRRFDMAFYPDEALYVHSFHTVVISRGKRLAANLEGNNFTAQQLGDLVETVAARTE